MGSIFGSPSIEPVQPVEKPDPAIEALNEARRRRELERRRRGAESLVITPGVNTQDGGSGLRINR